MNKMTFFQYNILTIIIVALIPLILLTSTSIVDYVDARKMSSYSGAPIPNTGTIGKTECCVYEIGNYKSWCTTCDNTHPPSNCGPAYPIREDKGGDTSNPKDSGGVLSNNDDSSNLGLPKGIDPSTGGTFNENSESSNQDNSKGIDPSNIEEGGTFTTDNGDDSSDSSKGLDSGAVNSGGVFSQ